MESSRKDDRLTAALEALRAIPAPAFAAELDDRAAAGFPRPEGSGVSQWASFVDWVRALTPRQVLLPSLATAFVAVVIATAVVATNQPGTQLNLDASSPQGPGASAPEAGPRSQAGGSNLGYVNKYSYRAEAEAPAPEAPAAGSAGAASALGAEGVSAPEAEGVLEPSSGVRLPRPRATHRDVERSAQVVLGAEPDAVADDASRVFEAVHAAQGIVLRSSVNDGSEAGVAGAHFELLIPSARLDDALGAISEIDEVLSRRDGTTDITAPTVGATERLQDSQARIDSLLNELAASETEIERETIEARLRLERRRASIWQAQVTTLRHRASMSHVSVRIEGSGSDSGGGGSWGIGDATGDAGHILAVAAGVVLIGLAVLAPVALIALLFWLGYRAWVRYGRRRVLE